MNALVALKKANKYTDLTALGLSSVVVDDVNKSITFTLTADGSQHTVHFDQPTNGASIVSVDIDDDNYLICTLSDGTVTKSTNPIEIAGTSGEDNKIESISVNGTEVIPDVNKNVNIEIPTISQTEGNQLEQKEDGLFVKEMSTKISTEEGNAITEKDDGIYVPSVSETKISEEEGNAIVKKEDGLYVATPEEIKISEKEDNQLTKKTDGLYVAPTDLTDYSTTDEVETLIDEATHTTTTIPAHYEVADNTTANALEVVADGTATDGQIDISSVTPLLDGVTVSEGDYVIWIETVETKGEIYARKSNVYSKSETDTKIAEAVTGGQVDLTTYVKHEEVEVMTEEELLAKIGLSEEELEGIAQLISDTEVRINKTYSSSKIYSELNRILEEGKTYTLEEIAKKSGASYKIATSTADMISTEYIYLLANGDTYDMYIVETEGSEPVKIGTTDINLSDYYTIEKINNLFALKTTVGDLTTLLTTNKKSIVDAINEFYSIVPKTYATKVDVGDISTMKTDDKTSIVNAINELYVADYNAIKTYTTKTEVGNLTALKTTDKTSIVTAINENFNAIYDANKKHATKTEIGDLTLLKTEDKDSVVNAINETWGVGYNAQKATDSIAVRIVNENLLDNPDFSINQRGLTEYSVSSKTYTVDRWKTANVPSLIIPKDKQITIQRHSSQGSSYSSLGQVVEKLSKGTYTFSVDIVSADASVPNIVMRAMDWADIANGTSGTYYAIKNIDNSLGDVIGRYSLTFTLPEDKENIYVYIYGANLTAEDAKFTIANAKLEVGSVATPFVAPHPATELAKCQRYYQVLNTGTPFFGMGMGSGIIRCTIPSVCKMAINAPSISLNCYHNTGTWTGILYGADGTKELSTTTVPTIAFNRLESSLLNFSFTFEDFTPTAGKMYGFSNSGAMEVILNAEL